jgi:hypothetical protein
MGARGLTFRALAEATREFDGKGMTHAHLLSVTLFRDAGVTLCRDGVR